MYCTSPPLCQISNFDDLFPFRAQGGAGGTHTDDGVVRVSERDFLRDFIVFLAAVAISLIFFPSLILILVNPSIYALVVGHVATMWFTFATFLLERMCKIKFRFFATEENIPNIESHSIVFANHRTRLDWMFVWPVFLRLGCFNKLRIILKDGLRNIGFVGWAMQQMRFIFLVRR